MTKACENVTIIKDYFISLIWVFTAVGKKRLIWNWSMHVEYFATSVTCINILIENNIVNICCYSTKYPGYGIQHHVCKFNQVTPNNNLQCLWKYILKVTRRHQEHICWIEEEPWTPVSFLSGSSAWCS